MRMHVCRTRFLCNEQREYGSWWTQMTSLRFVGAKCNDVVYRQTYSGVKTHTRNTILNTVRCPHAGSYVRKAGRGQLSSEWRHNENDVTMITAGLVGDGTGWRYGDWRRVATGCRNALVIIRCVRQDCAICIRLVRDIFTSRKTHTSRVTHWQKIWASCVQQRVR